MIASALEQAFTEHRRLLWGLGYRMLGTAADADEVVQEAFERALRHTPATDRPLRPWLVRVVVNVARDRLRRRRRAPYDGPWLPGLVAEPAAPAAAPVGERLEAISYALLVALEQLTPTQRAVWLLREVMGLSTEEAAEVLEVRPGSVKTTLHRARRRLEEEHTDPADPVAGLSAVGALASAVLEGDVAAVARLLAEDVVALSDGGGVFHAARNPVIGPERVARFLVGLATKLPGARYTPVWIQGFPGVLVEIAHPRPGVAPRSVTLFALSGAKIDRVWSVLEPTKLASLDSEKE